MRFKTFCVDFDNTLTEGMSLILRKDADRVLQRIKENGGEIAIWTCREGKDEELVKDFLRYFRIPYDSFNDVLPSVKKEWGNGGRKVLADCYIDDRGIYALMNGSIDWKQIESFIFEEVE